MSGPIQLAVLATAMVLGMCPWFAATAVAPALAAQWSAGTAVESWLTMAVQLGFVAGTLASAVLMLSDRWSPRRLAGGSALLAALATAGVAIPGLSPAMAITLRGVTGAALAGVYPPGMKVVAGWWKQGRGLAIGVLVGAVTLGSAAPHLVRAALPTEAWRPVLLVAATAAAAAGLLFLTAVREGPHQAPSQPFDLHGLGRVLGSHGFRLATAGYLGHMWELFAMWSVMAAFWAAMAARHALVPAAGPALAFASVAVGALGCVAGGFAADRLGRAEVSIGAMVVSGTCALGIGTLVGGPLTPLIAVGLVWGVTVVADSAQFSACVTELAPGEYVGTALTIQTCLGFLLTIVTIRLVPVWADAWGWERAFMPLAIGPAVGIVAMWPLRRTRERG